MAAAPDGVRGSGPYQDICTIARGHVFQGFARCINLARNSSPGIDERRAGIDPKARLNFCDCAAYALAKTMNAPLLFKGNDFTQTDIQACV
jgi:hypothetical protein